MKIKVDMHSSNIQDFSSVDLIRGEQGLIFDDSGISFRIIKISNTEYRLSEANGNYSDGFLSSFCKEFYDVKLLRKEIIETINGLRAIDRSEVEDFRTSGFIRWLARKEPRLNDLEGYDILKEMEVFERIIKMSTGMEATDPFKVIDIFEDDVKTDVERTALKAIRRIYMLREEMKPKKEQIDTKPVETKQIGARQTGAEQIIVFMREKELDFNDLLLALTMLGAKQTDIVMAQEEMVQTQIRQDRGAEPKNDEYRI